MHPGKYRLFGESSDGSATAVLFGTTALGWAVVQRDGEGRFVVPAPTQPQHPTTKQYAENLVRMYQHSVNINLEPANTNEISYVCGTILYISRNATPDEINTLDDFRNLLNTRTPRSTIIDGAIEYESGECKPISGIFLDTNDGLAFANYEGILATIPQADTDWNIDSSSNVIEIT